MATLQGQQINNTYPGLIKTNDEAAVDGTLKNLQDGAGNDLPIQVSSTEVNFTGTVSGVPAGPQGATGPQGPQGIEGPQGATGPQGDAGAGQVVSVVAGTNVTVDATDPANPIVSAAGGGGGGASVNTSTKGFATAGFGGEYTRANVTATSFTNSTENFTANRIYYIPIPIKSGETLQAVHFGIGTASTAGSARIGIFNSTTDVNGFMIVGDLVSDLGVVSTAATGLISIQNLGLNVGTSVDDLYFIAFLQDETWGIRAVANGSLGYNAVPYVQTNQMAGSITYRLGAVYSNQTYGSFPATTVQPQSSLLRYPQVGIASN